MARNPSETSVSTLVKKMAVDQVIVFPNPYSSVMVMVSNLKKKEDHSSKIFKIKYVNEKTTVTRIK